MPSVLIVDDQLLVRQGLKQVLGQQYRDMVIGEARNCEEAFAGIANRPWDLVILAISLPGKDGFYGLQEIRQRHPATRVLVLSLHADARYAARAKQLGACGYVSKSAGRGELLKALKRVLAGRKYFEKFWAPADGDDALPKSAKLSAREYRVMLALAAGRRPFEIAADLNLNIRTISTYKRRLLDKLQLESAAALVRYVSDRDLF
jgi:two-component system, NarL family, invasion response regulator UvrY